MLVFKPDPLLKWHRELVRRKWTFTRRQTGGRPPLVPDVQALIVRLANENRRWGYGKIEGELRKLGYDVGRSTIKRCSSASTFHQPRNETGGQHVASVSGTV
jgi:hypothetical protein